MRAVAVRDGYMDSFIRSATYLYGVSHTMPVISIVTDPDNLFDYNTGIMEMGPNAEEEFPYGSRNTGANFWMDWEYMAGFEYFDVDGQQVLQQNIGIALVGQYSRAEDQKAIGLYARPRYGTATFDFNPFPDLNFSQYHALVVRASGQDGKYTRLRDAVLTSLAEGTGVMLPGGHAGHRLPERPVLGPLQPARAHKQVVDRPARGHNRREPDREHRPHQGQYPRAQPAPTTRSRRYSSSWP